VISSSRRTERLSEGNPRALSAGDGLHREERSVLDRPEGPAPPGCGGYGADQADGAVVDVLQPAYSAVLSEQIWAQAEANITQKQHDPGTGHRGSAKRIKQLFEQYQK
jgi:hypothetical protein